MFSKPSHDRDLEGHLANFDVDGTTVASAFFDGTGVLTYPWRREVEAISGRERHTLRLEARSWPMRSKKLAAAARILSWHGLSWCRAAVERGDRGAIDRLLLAEAHDAFLRAGGQLPVDRLFACLDVANRILTRTMPASECLLLACEVVLDELPGSGLPFDGEALEHVEAECAGSAWGLYDVPPTWSDADIVRSSWRATPHAGPH